MLNNEQKNLLLNTARQSIKHGLDQGKPLDIDTKQYDDELQIKRATFVTLRKNQQLRGCIGILEPLRPLISDVAYNAWAAAFSDNRFEPLSASEYNDLDIHISILGTPESIEFNSEKDLISKIQENVDGLILEEDFHKSTFLPSVWSSVKNKQEFLNQLKLKAGLPADYWSDNIKIKRYAVEEF